MEDTMKKLTHLLTLVLCLLVELLVGSSIKAQMLNKEIYARRRETLMAEMDGGIAIFKNSEENKDFYYLTGFEESRAAFLLIPDADEKFIMFVLPFNPARKGWTGELCGIEGAVERFGADQAYPYDEFEKKLPHYLRGEKKIYCSFEDKELHEKLIQLTRRTPGTMMKTMIDPTNFIHEMRLIKSPEEITVMQKAIDITCDAHIEVFKAAEPGMVEYELQAVIEYIYRKNGSPRNGFPCIVGSGPNSVVLHYQANNRRTRSGDMVVMDIGAEYGGYTADVTRTIPINGKFTKAQREIYRAVLNAQKEAIARIAPGVGHKEVQDHATEKIKEGLYQLGLITDTGSKWQYRVWLTHGISHWLGLDVHDVGDYRRSDEIGRILEPGIVLTVEPGIYIQEDILDHLSDMLGSMAPEDEISAFVEKVKPIAAGYANIGVRIEDDVLVTADGHEILSIKAPKEIDEIERLMAERSYLNQ
jgi:Xaa-Pro aminopeptidase